MTRPTFQERALAKASASHEAIMNEIVRKASEYHAYFVQEHKRLHPTAIPDRYDA